MSEENKQEVLGRLKDGVINYNEEAVKEAAEEALEAGIDAYEAIMDGLTAGMVVVGDLYEKRITSCRSFSCARMPCMLGWVC